MRQSNALTAGSTLPLPCQLPVTNWIFDSSNFGDSLFRVLLEMMPCRPKWFRHLIFNLQTVRPYFYQVGYFWLSIWCVAGFLCRKHDGDLSSNAKVCWSRQKLNQHPPIVRRAFYYRVTRYFDATMKILSGCFDGCFFYQFPLDSLKWLIIEALAYDAREVEGSTESVLTRERTPIPTCGPSKLIAAKVPTQASNWQPFGGLLSQLEHC